MSVVAAVLATPERWQRFHEALSGPCLEPDGKNWRRVLGMVSSWRPRKFSVLDRQVERQLEHARVPIYKTDDVNAPSFIQRIRQLSPDLFMCAAYPQIFSSELLGVPKQGSINSHPSLLPAFRGAHPHFWAIAKGAPTSGLTAHWMTTKLDAGGILVQLGFPISECTYDELYAKLLEKVPQLIDGVRAFLANPDSRARPQTEAEATFFRNDRPIHHRIFWNVHTSEEIKNLTRTGRAFCFFRRSRLQILRATPEGSGTALTNDVRVEPGSLIQFDTRGVLVKTLDSCVLLERMRYRARRSIPGHQWALRYGPLTGEKLE